MLSDLRLLSRSFRTQNGMPQETAKARSILHPILYVPLCQAKTAGRRIHFQFFLRLLFHLVLADQLVVLCGIQKLVKGVCHDLILLVAVNVLQIRKVRHPYDRGILARKGIEY